MSWHIDTKGQSFIKELVNLMKDNDDYFIDICTKSEVFSVNNKDKLVIGVGSLMICFQDGYVVLINTDVIEHIDLHRPKIKENDEE